MEPLLSRVRSAGRDPKLMPMASASRSFRRSRSPSIAISIFGLGSVASAGHQATEDSAGRHLAVSGREMLRNDRRRWRAIRDHSRTSVAELRP
jgi:hypothetical protein